MRCQFCGWDNPQGKETCEKCNKPLTQSELVNNSAVASQSANHDRPTERKIVTEFDPKATVREIPVGESVNNNDTCPECGYSLDNGVCPSCGYGSAKKEARPVQVAVEGRKTVRPIRKGEKEQSFALVPISEESGSQEGMSLLFEGNNVSLNRGNTDPKNQTITSAEQAKVCYENGKWTIIDSSEYKTTFVQAAQKIELHEDDLILLGNQLYRFNAKI